MRRCTICRREGHNGRKHAGLTPEQLAELRQDGLDYLGRGFRELDQPAGDGGQLLLEQLADQADSADQGPQPSEAKQALADVVQTAVKRGASVEVTDEWVERNLEPTAGGASVVVGEQGPEPLQVPGVDAPDVLGPTGVIYVCAACGDPIESEPCRRHQPAAWAAAVGPEAAAAFPLPGEADRTTMARLRATAPPTEELEPFPETMQCARCSATIDTDPYTGGQAGFCPTCGFPDHADKRLDDLLKQPVADPLRPVEVVHLPGDQPAEADTCHVHITNTGTHAEVGDAIMRALAARIASGDLGDQGPQFVPWRTMLGPAEPIRITRPGVYQLDPEEYHADPVPGESLSNSDARRITAPGCPAQFRHDKDHRVREHKDAYDRGHVVHELVLGRGAGIVVVDYADWRTNAAKDKRAAAYSVGKAPILRKDYDECLAMAEAFFEDPYARALLQQPHKTEQALFWVDPSGVVRRGMLDILPTAVPAGRTMIIPDVKTSAEVSPDENMERKIMDCGYHRAAATYVDGVIALGLAVDAVAVFLFQSKKPPYLVVPVRLSPRALQIGRIENRAALATFAECQRSGVWPGYYDPEADIPELGLPGWYEKRFDGEM
jgi:hypothetical protein